MIKPEWGLWFVLIALLPLVLRIISGGFQFKLVDSLVVIFLLTAWAGYWAAYDPSTAWVKAWLVVTAVLLYFSLKTQPRQNLFSISIFLFCVGIGISFYYFLTHDFVAAPRKLELVNSFGRWLMNIRPQVGWTPVHPNYVAGMIAITVPFILYPVWELRKNRTVVPPFFSLTVIIGLGLACLALVMATSRGVVFALVSGVGGGVIWRFVHLTGIRLRLKNEAVFPVLLIVYLSAVAVFLYMGPAQSGNVFSGNNYGDGSRAELFERSLYLLVDYPFIGGGLGSFPGLYSRYILGIPYFYLPNSHNLFLDVGIEQGALGGLSFVLLYLLGIWKVSRMVAKKNENTTFHWIIIFSMTVAIVHGMVDDYLYNSVGTMFSLLLVGFSMNETGHINEVAREGTLGLRPIGAIIIICLIVATFSLAQIQAIWHANLGAIQLAKVELKGFPDSSWIGEEIIPKMDIADASLHSALEFDSANRTANYRLGLIAMSRREYELARNYLDVAHAQSPAHRGIIKQLGYSYVWLGNMEKAQEFLYQIPESIDELNVYVWWWDTQGRSDLANEAALALDILNGVYLQP